MLLETTYEKRRVSGYDEKGKAPIFLDAALQHPLVLGINHLHTPNSAPWCEYRLARFVEPSRRGCAPRWCRYDARLRAGRRSDRTCAGHP